MPSGKRDPNYWLYLEPFVNVATSGGAVLFYNSLTGDRFEILKSRSLNRIIKQLILPGNGYVAGLMDTELQGSSVKKLVSLLRESYMGDLLDPAWSSGKPVNILPQPYFKSHLTRELIAKPEMREAIDFDNYIHEAVLYLNSLSTSGNDPFALAARQFVFPGNTLDHPAELPWQELEQFMHHLTRYKITGIQVSGTNILGYLNLFPLANLLAKYGFPANYHMKAAQFDPRKVSALIKPRNSRVVIHFTFPIDLDLLNRILTKVPVMAGAKKIDFQFIISTSAELETAQEIISRANLSNVFLNPYYNGNNFGFFRETVFITREDIASSTPGQKQVFSRITLNEADFGKFTLLPDGSVHANINDPPVGNLGTFKTEELILKELIDGVSWMRTRKNVSPCKKCLYHFLCPPVSSYELLMKRFNFCDVYENPEE